MVQIPNEGKCHSLIPFQPLEKDLAFDTQTRMIRIQESKNCKMNEMLFIKTNGAFSQTYILINKPL